MSFKLMFAGMTAACLFYFLVATRKAVVQRLFFLVFFGTGLVFIMQPELTNTLAKFVGIGRGADLIFYVSTLLLFFVCFNFYIRFRSNEEQLTLIVRELAKKNPVREEL